MKCKTNKISLMVAAITLIAIVVVIRTINGNEGTSPSLAAAAPKTKHVTSRAYLHSYNLASKGVAMEGYCPHTYFAENKARPGSPDFASDFNGVTYYMSSAEAKRAFDANPAKYIPAYGGWCAYGMAVEDKFPVDPTNFKIVDGRLMLFLRNVNVDALQLWNKGDENYYIRKANAHWRKVSQ